MARPGRKSDSPAHNIERLIKRLVRRDPALQPYVEVIRRRLTLVESTERRLTRARMSIADFAAGHEYFGLHLRGRQWVLREWAPNATRVLMVGDATNWKEKKAFALTRKNVEGVWELRLPSSTLKHGDLYRLIIHWRGGKGDRIPAWARRVVQDPATLIFNAQVWRPEAPYAWRHPAFRIRKQAPLIYEVHPGMAQAEEKIGSWQEFTAKILPRIVAAGYNTLQLMAVQEHPFYGSFGYQVSSFFAASSRFGTPEDLKALVDAAHSAGIAVIMDLVHSHGVSNEVEGLSRYDGTLHQYFHDLPRGRHAAWDSRCFDYGKIQVLHFLLSNCRFWLDEYRVDGFRFDGVTSMLYLDHGIEKSFLSYDDYFTPNVDEDALTYLSLANRVVHSLRPDAITVAEDVSGMPGLAVPEKDGGFGFDFRFAMGIPDYWIKVIKEVPDEHWPMGQLWHELTNRRQDEKTISYAESHDQALVGDQSLIFRLIGEDMYWHMQVGDGHLRVARGMALHKMMRLITLASAGNGYLNFMGNEFGHPEWIDFPRAGNNWSYKYARRQWHLLDDSNLKYQYLARFDRGMIELVKTFRIFKDERPRLLHEDGANKVIAFVRAGLVFVFSFHPTISHVGYRIDAPPGKYRLILDSDSPDYGGHGRLKAGQAHFTLSDETAIEGRNWLSLYLPTRTAVVLHPEH
ncbi:MAG: alpha amylase C-terminal domain-containing protein [Desulfobacterales bacterium]|jgi:1,4-alpha-glucan branching enzyme|nr:alpha amylase C-terminal domain-containing protein [Desulfobacterales bacterium]